jgi:hypothetical protein
MWKFKVWITGLFVAGIFPSLNSTQSQNPTLQLNDTLVIIGEDTLDKRHVAAVKYLDKNKEEVWRTWSKGFYTNKKARKEFFRYYDSLLFSITPCVSELQINLPDSSIRSDIILKVVSSFLGSTRLRCGQGINYIDSALSRLASPRQWKRDEKMFELKLSAPYGTNLLAELFEGPASTPKAACVRFGGKSISILFVFDDNFQIQRVMYQEGINHYN